jgi:hypothetical protein
LNYRTNIKCHLAKHQSKQVAKAYLKVMEELIK